MGRPKKEVEVEGIESNSKEELKRLLMVKLPQCFDREPSPAYNVNLDKLVDEIVELFS